MSLESEYRLKERVADYLSTQLSLRGLNFTIHVGEKHIGGNYRADIVVETPGADVAIECKNQTERNSIRMAIGQASVYRSYGYIPGVALPESVPEEFHQAILQSGMYLFVVGDSVIQYQPDEPPLSDLIDGVSAQVARKAEKYDEIDDFIAERENEIDDRRLSVVDDDDLLSRIKYYIRAMEKYKLKRARRKRDEYEDDARRWKQEYERLRKEMEALQ